MEISNLVLFSVIIGIVFFLAVEEYLLDQNYSTAELGRSLHLSSLSYVLPSYFTAPSHYLTITTLILNLVAFGVTAICMSGARGNLQRESALYERAGFITGVAFFIAGMVLALFFWP